MRTKFAILTVSVISFLALTGQQSLSPSVSPDKLCPFDEISIIEPTGYNLSLLVRTPDVPYLILADHSYATVIPDYWTTHLASLRTKDLIGFGYGEDGPYVQHVFDKPGKYEFYFAELLGTEPENTISFTRYVEFLGYNHPDCPEPPPIYRDQSYNSDTP